MFDECGTSTNNGGAIRYDAQDLLAIDAAEQTTTNGQLYPLNTQVAGSMKIRNSVMVGNGGPLLYTSNATDTRIELRNFYDIGRTMVASASFPNINAHTIEDASLIDESNTGTIALMDNRALRAGAGSVSWKRVLILDPDAPAATPGNMFLTDDALAALSLTDIAVISPNRTGQADANVLWRFTSSGGASTVPIRMNRITVGMRPGETNEFTTGFYTSTGGGAGPVTGGFRTMQNALGANFWRTAAAALVALTIDAGLEASVTSPWCDVNNSTGFSGTVAATLTSGVRDVRQTFVNPAVGNLEPVKGSAIYNAGCGARKVGARDMWALRVLGQGIYNGYGDTWKVKSGGSTRRGPRATP
jgi:hypothetical protein